MPRFNSHLLMGSFMLLAAVSAAAQNARPANLGATEEIVVTAQRRTESLIDVPISISVLSGEKLDQASRGVLAELERVPGVARIDGGLGGDLLTVRGVGATATNFAGTSAVGYYLDSVPFGFVRQALAPDSAAYDLERVEVLRGPQGTLYGVSAQNGVVRVLTKDADLEKFEFKARGLASTTDGGSGSYRADAAVNIPIVEGRLAARAVVGYEDRGGWIERAAERNLNDAENRTYRLKVNAQPTDALSIGLLGWHTQNDEGGRSIARDNGTTAITTDEFGEERNDILGLRLGYDFGGVSLTSSTSYMDYRITSTRSFAPPTPQPFDSKFTSEVFAQEIALSSSTDGPLSWSVGGMYRDVEDLVHQFIPGSPVLLNPLRYNDYSESFAVFGELTYGFAEGRFDITGGLRYFEDRAETAQRSDLVTGTAPPLITNKSEFDKLSPRVVLNWHPNRDLTAYASYSEGFRSGFSQTPSILRRLPSFGSVKPDNLKNYEVGAKGRALDGLLEFDLAGYFNDWIGVQQSLAVQTPIGPLAGIVNGSSASGVGADLGITLRPASGLAIAASYSWNSLEFDSDVTTLVTVAGVATPIVLAPKGSRLGNSPETTAGLNVDYSFALGQFEATMSGSLTHVSERFVRGLVSNAPVAMSSDDITTGNVSIGITSPAGWGATLFVENVANYDGIAQIESIDPNLRPIMGDYRLRPRTVGLQFDVRY